MKAGSAVGTAAHPRPRRGPCASPPHVSHGPSLAAGPQAAPSCPLQDPVYFLLSSHRTVYLCELLSLPHRNVSLLRGAVPGACSPVGSLHGSCLLVPELLFVYSSEMVCPAGPGEFESPALQNHAVCLTVFLLRAFDFAEHLESHRGFPESRWRTQAPPLGWCSPRDRCQHSPGTELARGGPSLKAREARVGLGEHTVPSWTCTCSAQEP